MRFLNKKYFIKFLYIFQITCFNTLSNLNQKWILPNNKRHYHEVTFLTSHNSFSNEIDGYFQSQQELSLQKQLDFGVRAFMLDTHYSSNVFSKTKKVRLCHGNCALTRILLRPLKGKTMSFKKSLLIIKNFLEQNPKEIITLFLENYTDKKDLDNAISSANISNIILKPSDWNATKNKGWPTIKWMQNNNKRLVIFNQKGQTKYTFDEWSNHSENQFGTINFDRACNERPESFIAGKKHERYIHVLNYFPKFYIQPIQKINFDKINNKDLKKFFSKALENGIGKNKICKNRYPNFISLDYVNHGKGLKLVNKLNLKTNNNELKKIAYRKIKKQPNTF